MRISPARAAAFDVLMRVEIERAYTSALLPLFEEPLSIADSALCHELTLGTLRKQIYLDRLIAILAAGKKLDPAVRIAIRLGIYQILFLDRIPDHAAINESVSLVQRAKKTSAKGFVNAVLRRVTRDSVELNFIDDIDRISVETSHPRWLIEKWAADADIFEAEEIARSNNEIPPAVFRLTRKSEQIDPAISANWQRSSLVDGTFITERVDPELRELERDGIVYFQDEGSQMIAKSISVSDGGTFFDVCAAPGGKTGLIAQQNAGVMKTGVAGDLYWPRVEFLRDNCLRQEIRSVSVVQYNAETTLPFADGSFDVVLVDAPCSGTGTIRHNPELRYLLKPEDIVELSSKQLSILSNASKTVKNGGSLVYSTCSLEREENELVAQRFLAESAEFRLVESDVPQKFRTGAGCARTWPHRDNMDGFFIARFAKQD